MSFVLDISRFIKKANADTVQVVRKLAFESFKRIVLRTPVDTGRARANWGVTIGSPRVALAVNSTDKTGSSTLRVASEVASQFSGDGSIFMTNNLPYIGPLEYGSSKQAPTGMVRITVEEMSGFLKKTTISELKKGTR